MIPRLNNSGVLPPFLPDEGPTRAAGMAPYPTTTVEVIERFAHTPERKTIMKGLLEYRQLLRNAGIVEGFQWINGSYVESCEENRGRPPHDIDIVTFAERPVIATTNADWNAFVTANQNQLFDRTGNKARFHCDTFYIDLGLPSKAIVSGTRFWFGLFSHQRDSFLWKGLLEINLSEDDQSALDLLNGDTADAS